MRENLLSLQLYSFILSSIDFLACVAGGIFVRDDLVAKP